MGTEECIWNASPESTDEERDKVKPGTDTGESKLPWGLREAAWGRGGPDPPGQGRQAKLHPSTPISPDCGSPLGGGLQLHRALCCESRKHTGPTWTTGHGERWWRVAVSRANAASPAWCPTLLLDPETRHPVKAIGPSRVLRLGGQVSSLRKSSPSGIPAGPHPVRRTASPLRPGEMSPAHHQAAGVTEQRVRICPHHRQPGQCG